MSTKRSHPYRLDQWIKVDAGTAGELFVRPCRICSSDFVWRYGCINQRCVPRIQISVALVSETTFFLPPSQGVVPSRVTAGTSIDITFGPHPLTQKEDLLLLSLWRRHCHVPKGCALGTWLKGTNKELGPDNEESPHKVACPLNVAHPATAYNVRSTVGLEFLNKLPPSIPFNRCVTTELRLLITAFEIENMDLGVLVSVLLAGVIPDNFPMKYGMEWFGSLWQAALPIFSGMRRNGILPTHCLLMSALPG